MHYTDLMIDLETFDNKPTAAIIQIGLCAFCRAGDPTAGVKTLLIEVDPKSYDNTTSLDTLMWWMQQNEAARNAVCNPDSSMSAFEAAKIVNRFVHMNCTSDQLNAWALGANFDFPIIEHMYRQVGVSTPWKYSGVRCSRTFIEMLGITKDKRTVAEVAHRADCDAEAQARDVQRCYGALSKLAWDVI